MATPPTFSAGAVLTAAQMNQLGLFLIKSEAIVGTPSTINVTDVFSADFDNYLITLTGTQGSALGDVGFYMGTTLGATGYYGFMPYGIPSGTTLFAVNNNNGTNWPYVASVDASANSAMHVTLNAPFLNENTFINAPYIGGGNNRAYGVFNGWLSDTTSYTDFSIYQTVGTFTGGTIRVYGYRN
jgi:hypothetical protein